MEKQQYIDRAEHALYKVYNRFPVVFDHGEGVKLYDTDGQEYLDFGAGIAVMGLGYSCDKVKNAVKEQMEKLPHISNLFYNEPAIAAGEKLLAVSRMEKVFFTNSGTEAIEGALKIAKRYAYNKGMAPDYEIIAMKHSFHGRSLGALSVTGNDHYQEPFAPLIPNIRFAEFNNLDSVKALFSDKTCAVIMETIQGEGGIYPATEEFIKGVRALCDEHDALLMLDEIQCGMGRSGAMFAWQDYGVKPGCHDDCKGSWQRNSDRSFSGMRQSGNRHGAGGPWHDLRREPAGMCGSQCGTGCVRREEHCRSCAGDRSLSLGKAGRDRGRV